MPNKTLEKWEEKTINDVCIVERGSSPRPIKDFITTDNNGVNWIKIGDCSGKYVTNTAQKITQEGAKKSRYVKVGDFIISNSMSYGKPYILKIDGYIHDGWFVLRLNNDLVNTDYFYYLLSSNYIREQYDALATGAIVQNISSDLIKKVTFKLPPLSEQQRIVGILDEAFENIEKAKQNALQTLNNAKELFENLLNGIFVNKIDGWNKKTLEEIISKEQYSMKRGPFGSSLTKSCFVPKGIRVFEQYNPINNDPYWARYYITKEKYEELKAFTAKAGDLLVSCSGVTLGRIVELPDNVETGIINQALLKIKLDNSKILNKFFIYLFRSKDFQNKIFEYSQGVAIPNMVGVKELKKIKINYPSIEEQQKIVQQLDELQEQTKKLEQIYEQKLKDLDELKQSILQKAFNGEL